jgi:hypothetical protein
VDAGLREASDPHVENRIGFSECIVAGADTWAVRRIHETEACGPSVVFLDQLQRSSSSLGPECGRCRPGEDRTAAASARPSGVRTDLVRYCGEIERADQSFAAAMAVLRQHGEESNTFVVFMGDNGMAFPHGKGSLYDPGLNVPLIARWPGHIKPRITRNLISWEDVAATFMEAGGATIPKGVSGRSFWPLLTGGSYEPREYIFAARLRHGNISSGLTPRHPPSISRDAYAASSIS